MNRFKIYLTIRGNAVPSVTCDASLSVDLPEHLNVDAQQLSNLTATLTHVLAEKIRQEYPNSNVVACG